MSAGTDLTCAIACLETVLCLGYEIEQKLVILGVSFSSFSLLITIPSADGQLLFYANLVSRTGVFHLLFRNSNGFWLPLSIRMPSFLSCSLFFFGQHQVSPLAFARTTLPERVCEDMTLAFYKNR